MPHSSLIREEKSLSEFVYTQSDLSSDWRLLAQRSTAAARELLSYEQAQSLNVLPLRIRSSGRLLVALPATAGMELERSLKFATACELELESRSSECLAAARLRAYRGSSECLADLLAQASVAPSAELGNFSIPLLLEGIILRASLLAASDIHFQPLRSSTQLRFRLGGILDQNCALSIPPEVATALSRRIRVLCRLPSSAPEEVSEGSFELCFDAARIRLRVSILPTHGGEKIVIRLLEAGFSLEKTRNGTVFTQLGMSKQQSLLFTAGIAGDRGLVVASGPTGSGKSTLLAAALELLNTPTKNVVTLEDPVERVIEGVSQIEVHSATGANFADLLPKLLRQDPDVLMIGEIREPATARTACEASLTGTLVLTTVHASSALQCITRLLQLGISAEVLCSSLRLVSSQRLLALLCPHCKQARDVDPYFAKLLRLPLGTRVYYKAGCELCEQRGVLGRISVFEIITFSEALQHELLSGVLNSAALYQRLYKRVYTEGHGSIADGIRSALLGGKISPQTALEALGIRPDIVGYGAFSAA